MAHDEYEPPPKLRRLLEGAITEQKKLVLVTITLTPPKPSLNRWRVQVHYRGQRYDRSYGPSVASAYKGYLAAEHWLIEQKAGTLGRPEFENTWLTDFIDDYVNRRGKDGQWADRTQRQRKLDFSGLRAIADKQRLRCADLTAQHLRAHLASVSTAGRAATVKSATKTMLTFGRHTGYFTRDQAELLDAIAWTPPRGYVRAPSRREQSRLHGDIATGGEVMTFDQLDAWATKCQQRWEHGYALIHTLALLGTRSGEGRVLTADPGIANKGLGNLVDFDNGLVRVRVQAGPNSHDTQLPKLKKVRDIAIPRDAPAGFSLVEWLPTRIADAMREQEGGWNPRALIFPSLSGGVFGEQNLRNRVWAPAAEELGWRMGSVGGNRRLMRFTLHSLRDRYANTALHLWHYTEEVLLQQGSWKDPETVRRFYSGITDQTLNQALAIHGWQRTTT
jgi:integrase